MWCHTCMHQSGFSNIWIEISRQRFSVYACRALLKKEEALKSFNRFLKKGFLFFISRSIFDVYTKRLKNWDAVIRDCCYQSDHLCVFLEAKAATEQSGRLSHGGLENTLSPEKPLTHLSSEVFPHIRMKKLWTYMQDVAFRLRVLRNKDKITQQRMTQMTSTFLGDSLQPNRRVILFLFYIYVIPQTPQHTGKLPTKSLLPLS